VSSDRDFLETLINAALARAKKGVNQEGLIQCLLVRRDGMLLFKHTADCSNDSVREDWESLAALVCGAWQACGAMNGVDQAHDPSYELSFSKSSQGVYMTAAGPDILCASYRRMPSPGRLRRALSQLASEISDRQLEESAPNQKTEKERRASLFGDISDEEMDQLFGM